MTCPERLRAACVLAEIAPADPGDSQEELDRMADIMDACFPAGEAGA